MSNLYKSFSVVSKDKRVIDYNQVIQDKIEHIRQEASSKRVDPDGFVNGLDAQVVETLVENDSFSALTADNVEYAGSGSEEQLEIAKETAAGIVADARKEAQRILDEAGRQAEIMKQEAIESGMEQAKTAAQAEIDELQESLNNQFLMKSNQLENEYQEKMSRMEPELVETITTLFEKVVHVISEDNAQIIIDLINNAMHNMDMGSSFLIRVSPEDYPFVVNHQGKIYCAMSKDIQIDIFEDASLAKNQCKVESEFGVYDCSLDIQMSNLIKDIKLMSSLN